VGQAKNRGGYEERRQASVDKYEAEHPVRECSNCKHCEPPEDAPDTHCHLFAEQPTGEAWQGVHCGAHAFEGERRKPPGKNLMKMLLMAAAVTPEGGSPWG